jgi:hypothetical protein
MFFAVAVEGDHTFLGFATDAAAATAAIVEVDSVVLAAAVVDDRQYAPAAIIDDLAWAK